MGDISYALRTLRKSPLSSLTIVSTVALGLGMVAAVFTLLNMFLFRVDQVPNVHEFYGVERPRAADGDLVQLTQPVYEALRRETSVFSDVFAMVPETDSRVGGRTMGGNLVTGNFFQVLGVGAARGRVLTPADDDNRNPVVVLSDRGWTMHFERDPNIIGRTMLINGIRYDIVGVMPEGVRGLMPGTPDYWAPLSLVSQLQPALAARAKELDVNIIGRLRPGLSPDVALAQLVAWDSARTENAAERRVAGITLVERRGTIPQPMEAFIVFTPLFFAFGLILVIGCANVASLLLARGVSRQRELGVRLSLGASRAQIVGQLLTESLVLALAAAALGYAISRVILETIVWAVLTTMPPDIGDVRLMVPDGDWRVGVFLVGGAIVASVMFGLAPALQATRLELVRIMRGEIVRDARPGRARNSLIGLQVTASALLLICAAVFLRSAFAASNIDPGFRTADTAVVQVTNEALRGRLFDALAREPVVAAIGVSAPFAAGTSRPALAESEQAKSPAAYQLVSPEFFNVFGIDVVRGRTFTPGEGDVTAAVAMIGEGFARQLWPNGDALGQVVRLAPDPAVPPEEGKAAPAGNFTIVGIVRDVAGFPFVELKPANLYLPATTATAGTAFAVRVRGDSEVARRLLLERLTAVDPNLEQIMTMKTVVGMASYFLQLGFWLTLVLGGLALVLTLSGLFSVLSYLVEQRTKEIGVRMALGATSRDVSRLVVRQTITPVGIGLTIGAGMALALGILLVSLPDAGPIAEIVRLFDPAAYVAGILVILTACGLAAWIPALKAAHIDPMKSLRQE